MYLLQVPSSSLSSSSSSSSSLSVLLGGGPIFIPQKAASHLSSIRLFNTKLHLHSHFSGLASSFSPVSLLPHVASSTLRRSTPSFFCLASVKTETIETEPNTGVQFSISIKPPGSSSQLSLVGKGFREKNIAFIRVKVYAIGMYFDSDIATCLSSSWKSKKGADLYTDANLFKEILEAPVDKGIRIVLARDVDGATFWGALDEALAPKLKGGKEADKEALNAFGEVFRGRALTQGTSIYLTWVQPFKLQIALSGNSLIPESVEATIDSAALVSSLFDVYLGEKPVSPTAKESVALGLQALL